MSATAAIALLVNPDGPTANSVVQETQEAAHALGRRLSVLRASNEREIDTAWAGIVEQSAGGLIERAYREFLPPIKKRLIWAK